MLKKELETMVQEQNSSIGRLTELICDIRATVRSQITEMKMIMDERDQAQRQLIKTRSDSNARQRAIDLLTQRNATLHNKLLDKKRRKGKKHGDPN